MTQTLPAVKADARLLESFSETAAASSAAGQTLAGNIARARTDTEGKALSPHSPVVELAIPVYNEEQMLERNIRRLRAYLDQSFPFETLIRIVDNASTDETWKVATQLADTLPGVEATHLDRKGRGHALRHAWSASAAEIVGYMDVDLSTDLGAFLPLIAPLLSGQSDLAIGSRLARGAHVVRGPKRELISRAYNVLLKVSLGGRFSDAQCGFKALRRESAAELLPLVEDEEWFFDTELLIAAQRLGLRICEVPVSWVDDPDSRVKICSTALKDLRGVWRISRRRSRRLIRHHSGLRTGPSDQVAADQLLRFAGVGAISTLGYLLLFVLWRPFLANFGANAVALAICTLLNLTVHKELAKKMQGPIQRGRFVAVAAGLYGASLGLTSLALVMAHALDSSSLPIALLAVTAANAVAVLLRFSLLRAWVFRPGLLDTIPS